MMKAKLFLMSMVCGLCIACDHIAEGDRLIEVESTDEPATVVKHVLLEDFTGQRCSNCPTGTEVIAQLQEAYGDRLVAVGIHSGPLGFKGTATITGLATEVGDEYYNHWNLEYQPVGLIDRHGAVNYTDWAKAVRDALAQESTVSMEIGATVSGGQINITVYEEALADFTGRLQVWLLEDGITAIQTMPDGSNNREYVHNHVLRTPVNGTWGQPLAIAKGTTEHQTMTQPLDNTWNLQQLSIVAFVYNDRGVEQVVKVKIPNSYTNTQSL